MNRTVLRGTGLLAVLLQILLIIIPVVVQAASQRPNVTISDEKQLWTQLEAIRIDDPSYSDEFRRKNGDWTEVDNKIKQYSYQRRTYTITVHEPNRVAWSTNAAISALDPADYLVEVDAQLMAGPPDAEYGLLFRYVDDENFYQFTLSDGQFGLVALVAGEWVTLVPWTETAAIDAAAEAVNRVAVLAQGTTFTLLINDLPVAQIEDETFATGGVGLVVGTYAEGEATTAFDNLDFWSLATSIQAEQTQAATPIPAQDLALSTLRAADPLFHDDFRTWDEHWTTDADGTAFMHRGGEADFAIQVFDTGQLSFSQNDMISELALSDYLAEVDATYTRGPRSGDYGLLFRFVNNRNFYFLGVSDTAYMVRKLVAGEWTTLVDWTEDPAIQPDKGAVNRLGVLVQGTQITALVNDVVLAQLADDSLATGGVALAVGTFAEGGYEVVFDNVTIWSVAGAAPQPVQRKPIQQQSNPTTQTWTTYESDAFILDHPDDWRVTQDESGQIAVAGLAGEVVLWPTFVQGEVSAPLAGAILTEFAGKQAMDRHWSHPQALAENALLITGGNATHTTVATIVWVNSPQGAAPTLYLLDAPTATFAGLEATFVRILASFQIKGAAANDNPARPQLQFVDWTDPVEGAFHTQVPADWQAEGGLLRAAAVDVRPWLHLTSPDGAIQVFSGDQRIPPFTLPNETLAWTGFTEGEWYSPGYGVQMLISRYLPGEEFAAMYVTDVLGLTGCTIDAMGPLAELEAALLELQRSLGGGLIGQQQDIGDVYFTCQDGGQTVKGYVLAYTNLLEQAGSGVWNVMTLAGYLAPPAGEGVAQAVLGQLAQTWQIDPQWAAMQQGTTAAVANIVSATGNAIAETINSTFATTQASQDRLSQAWADTLLEVERVQDERTGQVYEVMSGATYHWIDAQGNIVGTNAHFNPDGLRFEEMVRAP